MSLIDKLILPEKHTTERDFYEVIESHLTYLKNHPLTRLTTVQPDQAAIYKGDFFGLLNSMSVDKKYHYPIMRVSGYLSSSDYNGLDLELYMPSEEVVNEIMTVYLSREEN